ncbi:hypothetical protein J437_LFUL001496 [Ladona fulva]|uniref:Cytochrome P450 n=1 Tax=Ladona fulva TaxID=123851 RepID=A0A8K0NVS3_LADFU|nr:hypothetical protein J437_LFUL001496 [Ladona fulva]
MTSELLRRRRLVEKIYHKQDDTRGPGKWPLLGSKLEMMTWGKTTAVSAMNEAAHRYGDVVGLFTGDVPIILVSGLEAIKEVSSRDDFSGRPISIVQTDIDKGSHGLIMAQGEKWKEQRRFTLRNLKDLGFGKRSLEGIAHEEIEEVFEEIEKLSGGHKTGWKTPVLVQDILGAAGINVLWHIIAGKRYSHNDPYLKNLMDNVKKLLKVSEIDGGVVATFPLLCKWFPFLTKLGEALKLRDTLHEFIQEEIRKHRESLDPENPRDFIDIYITEVDQQKENKLSTFEDKQLVFLCVDLFMAGSDTTFNTLTFAILYMILYPEKQQKVQEELDRVVGKDRLPSLEDRPNLPYVEATLSEILRQSSVAPLSVPHATLYGEKDAELQGYFIPKNSALLLNLYKVHHDPKIWGDPQNFRPERFLDENGKFVKHEALIPFGLGD